MKGMQRSIEKTVINHPSRRLTQIFQMCLGNEGQYQDRLDAVQHSACLNARSGLEREPEEATITSSQLQGRRYFPPFFKGVDIKTIQIVDILLRRMLRGGNDLSPVACWGVVIIAGWSKPLPLGTVHPGRISR
jgi:hypothetical protein